MNPKLASAMNPILVSCLASLTAKISAVSMADTANTNAEAENEAAQQQDQGMLSQLYMAMILTLGFSKNSILLTWICATVSSRLTL